MEKFYDILDVANDFSLNISNISNLHYENISYITYFFKKVLNF